MSGKEAELISKENFKPFKIGHVANICPIIGKKPIIEHLSVEITYPSRLNAMAIDPSRIAYSSNRQFAPGEVVFAVDIPLVVKAEYREDGKGDIRTDHPRSAIVKHSGFLMKEVLGFSGSLEIEIRGSELLHCGLGSSSRLSSAVAAAIHELFGKPIPKHTLVRYLAQNHGEEISGDSERLMPVQCIGGSAAAGFYHGGCLVLAGCSMVIASAIIPDKYYFVVGWPRDYQVVDAKKVMTIEIDHLEKFIEVGKNYGKDIAYRILHEMLPALAEGNYQTVGDVIEWYRYQLGSIRACNFTYPKLSELAKDVIKLRRDGVAEIVSLSSVGPGFFALTDKPEKCANRFHLMGCDTIVTKAHNEPYRVVWFGQKE